MVILSELSETSSSSSSTRGHRYDVFLSFRGLDTRKNFTHYLYNALVDANITTFLDDKEVEDGEDLKPELKTAIKASRASIIVLSARYASSTWCLDELVLILKQHKKYKQIVIPVFYHVEPTHVRKQESSFRDAMAKHRRTMEAETNEYKRSRWEQKINQWSKALEEAANLKGKDVNGRVEMEFIDEIVKDIHRRLRIPLKIPLPLLIGKEESIACVTSWLKGASSHTTDILTVYGMGGIGKTSLAKYVYRSHFHDFETSSFIENISGRCNERFSGLLEVQKQLCNDILKTSSIQVHDVSTYTSKIENAVGSKKVFLVLDDIDTLDQLDALLGSKGFRPGSKVIITTKYAWLTESCALFKKGGKPTHAKYFVRGLDEEASRKLLCFHAFMCNNPRESYEEVTEEFVKYCEGHPLAVEVLGKSLHNQNVAYWGDWIEQLKKGTGSPIDNVLRKSFDSLQSENDKDLFKHIACFFVGTDRDVTETILKACDMNTKSGITNLINRCLLRIEWDNKLMMHQLLQNMGRSIVHQESPQKPWKRSLLWCHEESFKVLKQKKGKRNIHGLALDMRMLKKEKLRESFKLKTDALSNMDDLMLLQLNYVQISGSYENFPEELKWLCIHGFSLKSIPLDLPMENLVALDMSYSNIESFDICYSNPQRLESRQKLIGSWSKEKRLLGSLKILNLSFCEHLRRLGSFEELRTLERLIVTNCNGLLEVCESIEHCVELVFIDLSYCTKLEKLPRNMRVLKKVETLLLIGCNLGGSRSEIRVIDSQEILKANNVGIHTKSSSSAIPETIPRDLKLFAVSLPISLVSLSLADNGLSTDSFPVDFSCLSMLKNLSLDGNPIVSMPSCVRSLPRLETLDMIHCNMLETVEYPPHTLKCFEIFSGDKCVLRKVVFDPRMSALNFIIQMNMLAPSSFEFEGMIKVQPMACVEEKVLHSLGWTKLDLDGLKGKHVGTFYMDRGYEKFEIQMYFEFGIFSTVYGGEEMPNWITNRSTEPSISFTIPSSPNNLTGLNFCCVVLNERLDGVDVDFLYLPQIKISNITKNHTWIYHPYALRVDVGGDSAVLLSHWMFKLNEMEDGDHVTITTSSSTFTENLALTKECGVSFVYEDGDTNEDVLGYYKSWNHIIGGDLTAFQTTTGEYFLSYLRFMYPGIHVRFCAFVGDNALYEEDRVRFRALFQGKSDIPDRAREVNTHSNYQSGLPEFDSRGPVTSLVVPNPTPGPKLLEDVAPVPP